MLLNLFNEMRAAKVPVSVRELLDLINALKHNVVFADMDEFYYLARAILVKDERHFDKFDRAFGAYFKGLENLNQHIEAMIPEEWLRKEFERLLSDEEKAQIQSLGGLDKLIEELKRDEAIAEADTLLLTVPSQLGVDYNAHLFENLAAVARELGWKE